MSALYETDFYSWCLEQSEALRLGNTRSLDLRNLAEEIGSMGISQENQLVNRLTVLMCHLLKKKHQPDRCGKSWENTITEQGLRVKRLLKKNPGLKSQYQESIAEAYEYARLQANTETGLPEKTFSQKIPSDLLKHVESLKDAMLEAKRKKEP